METAPSVLDVPEKQCSTAAGLISGAEVSHTQLSHLLGLQSAKFPLKKKKRDLWWRLRKNLRSNESSSLVTPGVYKGGPYLDVSVTEPFLAG